jgi:hypothetical protein
MTTLVGKGERPKAQGTRHKARAGALLALLVLLPWCTAAAQSPAAPEQIDPIRCWWRTSAGAVATGEPFDATLTCAVREDGTIRAVPDESRLGAEVIQLAPFEVIGGAHPADLRTETHRFFQFHYRVRVIDRDLIGRDARFPDLQLSYRVHTRASADSVEGRDRIYVLPGQSIRILSLVPAGASDIRDSEGEDFARSEALQFRSRALKLAGLALGALGLIVLVPVLVSSLGPAVWRKPSADPARLPAHALLTRAASELGAVQDESRGGWTPELVSRAAAAVRLAAACALGRRVSQHPADAAALVSTGRIAVRHGWLRPARLTVSSAITASELTRAIDELPLTAPAERRQVLEDLHRSLAAFTAALYRPSLDPEGQPLGNALEAASAAVARLGREHAWYRRLLTRGLFNQHKLDAGAR